MDWKQSKKASNKSSLNETTNSKEPRDEKKTKVNDKSILDQSTIPDTAAKNNNNNNKENKKEHSINNSSEKKKKRKKKQKAKKNGQREQSPHCTKHSHQLID